MPQSNDPEQDLAAVERRIVEAEMAITRQRTLIDRLARTGQDTVGAHAVLNEMMGALAVMYTHRRLLLGRGKLKASQRRPSGQRVTN